MIKTETLQEMIINKCILNINHTLDLFNAVKDCIKKVSYIKKIRINAEKYVQSKSSILDKTIKKIKKYLI